MNELYRALGDISSIRKQVANSTEFRGYGPATLAATGVLALAAAAVQQLWVREPDHQTLDYLMIWVTTAIVCAGMTAWQMYTRSRRLHSQLSDEMIRMAAEQFVPSLVTGLFITVVLLHFVPQAAWMLPGLWQIVFALGVFASCRFLPKSTAAAGAWYLLTGLTCLAAGDARALSPWMMGVPFGLGQLLIAGVLQVRSAEVAGEEQNERR